MRRLKRTYPGPVADARKLGPETASEMVLLAGLFNVAARRDGREDAYDFLRGIFQRVAEHSMSALYQIDDLVACEGDPFENFKKFNVAMFETIDREGTWKTGAVSDEGDRLRIEVGSCANVDLLSLRRFCQTVGWWWRSDGDQPGLAPWRPLTTRPGVAGGVAVARRACSRQTACTSL